MHGQQILQSLHALQGHANAAAMIRHAQRHSLGSATDPTAAVLTEEGKAAARALGSRLRGFAHLRLFHSPVTRCRQTAECVAEGAAQAGLHVEIVGEEHRLGFGYTHDMPTACQMYTDLGDEFVTRWFTGRVSSRIISAPARVAEDSLEHIVARLRERSAHGRRLDLHVSHDWNVMVMRELLTGVRHEEAGWLGFLDGLAFSSEDEAAQELAAHYAGRRVSRPLPWTDFVLRPNLT